MITLHIIAETMGNFNHYPRLKEFSESTDGLLLSYLKSYDIKDLFVYIDFVLGKACENGHIESVKYLVSNNANIHVDDDVPLKRACQNGHHEIVRYLLDHGADVHAKDDRALIIACQHNG